MLGKFVPHSIMIWDFCVLLLTIEFGCLIIFVYVGEVMDPLSNVYVYKLHSFVKINTSRLAKICFASRLTFSREIRFIHR